MCHKQSKTSAALKQVHFTTEDDLDDYSVEISILSECRHKNIVALLESFLYDNKLWVGMLFASLSNMYFYVSAICFIFELIRTLKKVMELIKLELIANS